MALTRLFVEGRMDVTEEALDEELSVDAEDERE